MRSSNNNKSHRSKRPSDGGGKTTSSKTTSQNALPSSSTSRRRSNNNKKSSTSSSSSPRLIAPPPPPATACDLLPPPKRFTSFHDEESDEHPPPHNPSYYQRALSNSISAAASLMMTGSVTNKDKSTTTTTTEEYDATNAAAAVASPSRRRSSMPPPPMAVASPIDGGTSTTTPTSTLAVVAVVASNNNNIKKVTAPPAAVETEWTTDLDRRYDLTPVGDQSQQQQRHRHRGGAVSSSAGISGLLLAQQQQQQAVSASAPPSYFIDPWEVSVQPEVASDTASELAVLTLDADPSTPNNNNNMSTPATTPGETNDAKTSSSSRRTTFIAPGDIHPNMENKEDEIAHLRLLAGKLSADWRGSEFMAPALARRIRDFQFAQEKRRRKYGDERPWGILGLYDHLSAIRTDVEWAEDQAWRRANGEPYMSWADFDESKRGGYNRPFFTYILLITCTIIMITSIGVNGWKVEPLAENPMIGPSAETLILMGAKSTPLIVEAKQGWRLLSSAVLHAGLVHFLINMLALWFVGAAIETTHGWFAAMVIFIISAVGGTILSAIFLPEYITVGASGGIFGFIGACCADICINWRLLFCDFVTENGKKHRHILVVVVLLLDIILNCIIGLTPYVDNFTHLGGMAYGFLCGLSTIERLSSDFFGMEEGWLAQVKHFIVRFFGLIVSIVSIVTTLILLLRMDATSNPCPNCTWLSCVPFPPWAGELDKWWYCDDCARVTAEIVPEPYRHLELDCPDGSTAEVNFTSFSSQNMDRAALQKNLPTYCRQYCLVPEEERN